MSFRRRLALCCAAAVAVAVVLGSVLGYLIVRGTLRGEIDDSLRSQVARGGDGVAVSVFGTSRTVPAGSGEQILSGKPQVFTQRVEKGTTEVPQLGNEADAMKVATGKRAPFFADRTLNGVHVRVYTASIGPGNVVQTARPLTEVDNALSKLRWALAILALGGIGLSVVFSRLAEGR